MDIDFAAALTAVGLLLILSATGSGLVQRTILSLSVVSVAAGAVLEVSGVLTVTPGAEPIVLVVEVVLLVTLFSDGLLVEHELLRRHWRAPVRALVIAMPVNAILLAIAGKALFDSLGWAEALLLGFILSPTDPVITSSVVASPQVPQRIRHILNIESGLNDGLALPFVLLFLAISAGTGESALASGATLALESAIGLAVGGGGGVLAGLLLGLLPSWAISDRYEGLYALGLGPAAFGGAELLDGNGLIAAFVAAVVLAMTRREMPTVFHELNENVSSVLQLVAFALFGALIIETGWSFDTRALVVFIGVALFVARPLSIAVSFAGIEMSRPERAFIAWFGPKGIASMLFALFVLNSGLADRTLVFDVAAFTILASIVAHGLTDTVGSSWIARRMASTEPAPEPVPEPAPER